jgi:hypothetical protein
MGNNVKRWSVDIPTPLKLWGISFFLKRIFLIFDVIVIHSQIFYTLYHHHQHQSINQNNNIMKHVSHIKDNYQQKENNREKSNNSKKKRYFKRPVLKKNQSTA